MEASDEVYEYISCNLCLVKLEDPGLVYTGEKFEHKDRRWQIGMLVHGFIFPSFEDRTSDIHNITVFNKKSDGAFDDFDQEILGLRPVASADMQKQSFTAVLVEELKADMDEKPMKATNIVDKKTTKIKAPDVEIKIDVEHSSSIEKREIDGVTYLPVPLSATSDIEIDGIKII